MGSSESISSSGLPGNVSDLVAVLRDRAPRIAVGVAAGQMMWPVSKTLREKLRERTRYTVRVSANDDIYDELHEWVLDLLPHVDRRALVVWTSRRDGPLALSSDSMSPSSSSPRLRLRYDGSREQTITVGGGHKIKVMVEEKGQSREERRFNPDEIVFTTSSLAAKELLLTEISGLVEASHQGKRKPVFRMLSKWGEWERLDDLPERDLDSVILPDGQIERLVADVQRFLDSEADYLRRCVPWHRGHLYEGPPGTGKTSVARALASHFGMDVWCLPLADVEKDGDLLRLITRIGPRSMLLLEDIDIFHSAKERDDAGNGTTLSGLLNALDGISTPHGLLTILTTNDPSVLDDAIIRPGRVDLAEHFALATGDQIGRLLSRWYSEDVCVERMPGLSPAEVIEVCKRYDHLGETLTELVDRVGVR